MANSLLIKSPSTLSGGARPKLVRHPSIRPGTKFLYDFTDPRCNPNGVITPGTAAIGTIYTDLTAASVPASIAGVAFTANSTGALVTPANNSAKINIGSAGQFDLSAAPVETVFIFWAKINSVPSAVHTEFAGYYAATPTASQMWLASGSSTAKLNAEGYVGAAVSTITGGVSVGTVHQIAVHFTPGVSLEMYLDGVLAYTATANVPTTLTAAPSAFFHLDGLWSGTIYGASYTDITGSIAAEQAAGYKSADILNASRYIARDYAFGMGTLTGAPRTAYS